MIVLAATEDFGRLACDRLSEFELGFLFKVLEFEFAEKVLIVVNSRTYAPIEPLILAPLTESPLLSHLLSVDLPLDFDRVGCVHHTAASPNRSILQCCVQEFGLDGLDMEWTIVHLRDHSGGGDTVRRSVQSAKFHNQITRLVISSFEYGSGASSGIGVAIWVILDVVCKR